MPKINPEQSTKEIYTSTAGLLSVGECLNRHGKLAQLNAADKGGEVSNADMLRTYIGLLCQGKSDFEAVERFRHDEIFKLNLQIERVLSSSRLRQRFDRDATRLLEEIVLPCNVNLLKNLKVQITPLPTGHVVIDADVSPFDNSKTQKERIGWTYKGFDGYAPMLVYLGREGWGIAAELRPGNWNGQRDFVYVMERARETARELTQSALLWRFDSQHDALENRCWLLERGDDFLIKWNKRQESAAHWLKYAERADSACHWEYPRAGKRVGRFSITVEQTCQGHRHAFRRVMQVTERTTDKKGQHLLIAEIEVEGWWTSLELPPADIIALYADHGTSEQFHSEYKTDLDLERLPSGKFDTNDLVLNCGMIAYNILKHIGIIGLLNDNAPVRHPAKRRRVKTVMQEVIYCAARLIRKGRQVFLRFSKDFDGFSAFCAIYRQLQLE